MITVITKNVILVTLGMTMTMSSRGNDGDNGGHDGDRTLGKIKMRKLKIALTRKVIDVKLASTRKYVLS